MIVSHDCKMTESLSENIKCRVTVKLEISSVWNQSVIIVFSCFCLPAFSLAGLTSIEADCCGVVHCCEGQCVCCGWTRAVQQIPHVGPAAFVTLDKSSWVAGSLISLSTKSEL